MRAPRACAMRQAAASSSSVSCAPSSRALNRSAPEVDGVGAVGHGRANGVEGAGGREELGNVATAWRERIAHGVRRRGARPGGTVTRRASADRVRGGLAHAAREHPRSSAASSRPYPFQSAAPRPQSPRTAVPVLRTPPPHPFQSAALRHRTRLYSSGRFLKNRRTVAPAKNSMPVHWRRESPVAHAVPPRDQSDRGERELNLGAAPDLDHAGAGDNAAPAPRRRARRAPGAAARSRYTFPCASVLSESVPPPSSAPCSRKLSALRLGSSKRSTPPVICAGEVLRHALSRHVAHEHRIPRRAQRDDADVGRVTLVPRCARARCRADGPS